MTDCPERTIAAYRTPGGLVIRSPSFPTTSGGEVLIYLVGVRGFEPPTTGTPCRCATRLRYTPNQSFKPRANSIRWGF